MDYQYCRFSFRHTWMIHGLLPLIALCLTTMGGKADDVAHAVMNKHADITPMCGTKPVFAGHVDGFGGATWFKRQVGIGDASSGIDYTLASIAAVVMGGASLFGARGSFIGAVLGAFLIIKRLESETMLFCWFRTQSEGGIGPVALITMESAT